MDKSDVLNLVAKFSALAQESMSIKSVWLYGSWAYGTPTIDSDIDVAVALTEAPENILFAEKKLFKIRRLIDTRIEPVIVSQANDRSGFFTMISSKGIQVYP